MSDFLQQDMAAGEKAIVAGGLFFKLVSAPAPVQIKFIRENGSSATASNAVAGYTFGPVPETRRIRQIEITSAAEQKISYIVGDDRADVEGVNVDLDRSVKAGARHMNEVHLTLTISTDTPLGGVTGTDKVVRGYLLKSMSANTVSIFIAGAAMSGLNQGLAIEPGESQFIPVGHSRNAAGHDGLHAYCGAAGQILSYAFFYDDDADF